MIRVCSGFSPKGYIEYGHTFLETFAKHWPGGIDLVVYTEEPVFMPRGECRSLWDCRGAREFIERHKGDPEKCGTKQTHLWNPRYHGRPYNFRFDAVKFCRQLFIPEHAAHDLFEGDILVWLDADVHTFADIPRALVDGLLNGRELAYLGRVRQHSEIGFWAVRINDRTRKFLAELADIWRSNRVFVLPEWHSAFVFDWVRGMAELEETNLTPQGRGHVFDEISPLRRYMTHLKGDRKKTVTLKK